jgi:hypothetical protein
MDPAQKSGAREASLDSDVYRVRAPGARESDWRRLDLVPGARTQWLLEHAAAGLGVEPPADDVMELDWIAVVFSETNALTLYMAARDLADEGHPDEALEVLGDACRAQQHRRSVEGMKAAARADFPEEVA